MRDWLQDIPDFGVAGVAGVQPQKTAISERCRGVASGVAGVADGESATPETPSDTQGVRQKSNEINGRHPRHLGHRKNSVQGFDGWVSLVSALDPREPLAGHDARRWFNLVECSVWWLENFGRQAAPDGWDSISVFGVIPGEERAGGLIDRLGTSRTLVMDGKRSRWRSFGGVVMKYNAGAYKHLPLFWEAS